MNNKWNLFSLQGNVIGQLSGFLFVTMVDGSFKGFIADSDNIDSIDKCTKIILSESNIQKIFEQDETFGSLVGSEYFYFAMPVILKDVVVCQENHEFILIKSSILILFEDDIRQEIFI
uniref:hypothetical protein n=1 Tax=Salmonella enterica TaxID=28901 RepID=UPI003A95791D